MSNENHLTSIVERLDKVLTTKGSKDDKIAVLSHLIELLDTDAINVEEAEKAETTESLLWQIQSGMRDLDNQVSDLGQKAYISYTDASDRQFRKKFS